MFPSIEKRWIERTIWNSWDHYLFRSSCQWNIRVQAIRLLIPISKQLHLTFQAKLIKFSLEGIPNLIAIRFPVIIWTPQDYHYLRLWHTGYNQCWLSDDYSHNTWHSDTRTIPVLLYAETEITNCTRNLGFHPHNELLSCAFLQLTF